MHVCVFTLYIILVFLFIMRVLSKTHQSSLTLKGGSTAFPKPLSPQGTGDVPTALSIVFTTPSVPLAGDRNGAQTATLYGWRTIRGLRQQRSCGFLCGMNRRDTMQDDYGDALLGLLLMGAQGPDNVQHN